MGNITTIQIKKDTKKKLDSLKLSKKESYNDVIENLIEDSELLSEQTIKEIEESRKEYKQGKILTLEQTKEQLGLS